PRQHCEPPAWPTTGRMAWAGPRRRSPPDAPARCCNAGPQSRRVENPHEVRGFAVTSRGPLKSEDVLSRLVLEARQDLQRRRHLMGSDELELAVAAYTPRDFIGALRRPGLTVIAEMKQRTPSMVVLSDDYRPAEIARAYADGGAAAISVLTHMAGFGGRPEHIRAVRPATQLPLLRKDLVPDP